MFLISFLEVPTAIKVAVFGGIMLVGMLVVIKNTSTLFMKSYGRMQKRNAKVIKKYIKREEYCIVFELDTGTQLELKTTKGKYEKIEPLDYGELIFKANRCMSFETKERKEEIN